MKADLYKNDYSVTEDYEDYIHGSANVVGLMCLKVFVNGDLKKYNDLKFYAMSLGSAFQKVNFLRDLKDDYEILGRSYFPNLGHGKLDIEGKQIIILDIEEDFKNAYTTDFLQELINLRLKITPIFINGSWCEIDTPKDLELARKKFQD